MKLADITPVHKKDDTTNKSNYRPISGLPSGSKIFERIIQRQIGHYMETFLRPYLYTGIQTGVQCATCFNCIIRKTMRIP